MAPGATSSSATCCTAGVSGLGRSAWTQNIVSDSSNGKTVTPKAVILKKYCGLEKPRDEFSDEHIWPDALGGDHLPDLWRTHDVCIKCNSMSGLRVDGAFIKSWIGAAERATGALEYLSLKHPDASVLPLNYMGPLPDVPTQPGELAEYWIGPCGAIIIYVRPDDTEEDWKSYAGGDPRSKPAKTGRAYITLTSEQPFWVLVSLASFKAHFKKAQRFIVNMDVPPQWRGVFRRPDTSEPVQAADMAIVNAVRSAGNNGEEIRVRPVIKTDLGTRFLAKLGLAIGFKLLDAPFLSTEYAQHLRAGFREADQEKIKQIPVNGTGYLSGHGLNGVEKVLHWPGAWVLLVKVTGGILSLSVVSPSGKNMNVVVCKESGLLTNLDEEYKNGKVWLTIPSLGEAAGPINTPNISRIKRAMRRAPNCSNFSLRGSIRRRCLKSGCRVDGKTAPFQRVRRSDQDFYTLALIKNLRNERLHAWAYTRSRGARVIPCHSSISSALSRFPVSSSRFFGSMAARFFIFH